MAGLFCDYIVTVLQGKTDLPVQGKDHPLILGFQGCLDHHVLGKDNGPVGEHMRR